MIRRSSRILLEVVAGLVGVLVLLGAGAAWRLSQGPVSLDFAVPYVHEELVKAGGPVDIGLEDIILTWAGWDRTLDIRVLGVAVRNRKGAVIAALPEVSVSLAMVALMQGEIAPTQLELIGPRLRAHRTKAGDFELAVGEQTGPTGETLPLIVQALSDPHDRESPLALLQRISIVGGDLSVDDRMLGTTWRAPRLDIDLARGEGGISARFGLDAALEGHTPRLSGTANFDVGRGTIVVDADLKGVRPDRLAKQVAALAPFAGLALPVDAEFEVRLTADGTLRSGRFKLNAGSGTLDFPDVVPRAVAVRSAEARGSLDVESSRVVLDRATFDLGGPTIELSAVVERARGIATVSGEAVIRKMPIADFKSYWPENAAPGARRWVVPNMEDGEVAEARVNLRVRSAPAGEWSLDSIDGSLRIEGATVHYLKPLIPIRKAGATVTVAKVDRVDITIDGGDLNGLEIDTGTIGITDDGHDNWTLALETVLHGGARNVLEILDHPRLRYASELGVDVARVAGRAAIRLRVGLPLLAALELDQVDIQAAANLVEVAMPGVVSGHDARDGAVTVQLDGDGMTVSGTARLAEIPTTIAWYENFKDDAPFVRRYDVKATLDDAARARLGLDAGPFLAGPVAVDMVLIKRSDSETDLTVRLGLDQATLALSPFGWSKSAGMPGAARFDIALAGERIAAVRDFDIQAGDLVARGDITLGDDGKTIGRAQFRRFSLGERTDLSGVVARRPDGGFDVSISGPALDGETLLNAKAEAEPGDASPTLPPIRLRGSFERLWINAAAKIDSAEVFAEYDGATWRAVSAARRTSKNRAVKAVYQDNARDQTVTLDSNDAGALLRTIGIFDNLTGGRLVLKAKKQGRDEAAAWRGHVAVTDFRIAKAPILARLLTLASLTGISDLAAGKGIAFKQLDIPFAMQSRRLTISDARAVGSQIGIGSSGEIDFKANKTELEGTVVPAYTLNTLVGKIPLLGNLFTGGKGGGVFAVSYTLSGPLDNPEIRVNPLTVLAPGILRNLVRGLGKAGTDSPPEPEVQD